MKAIKGIIEYDWSELSLNSALDLLKERKRKISRLEIDGDNKVLKFYTRYIPSLPKLEEGQEAIVNLENMKTIIINGSKQSIFLPEEDPRSDALDAIARGEL